jgi:hypothetical protein
MAVIQFFNLMADVWLWLDEKLTDKEFNDRCKARKSARKRYLTTQEEQLRLKILRDLQRNDPRRR